MQSGRKDSTALYTLPFFIWGNVEVGVSCREEYRTGRVFINLPIGCDIDPRNDELGCMIKKPHTHDKRPCLFLISASRKYFILHEKHSSDPSSRTRVLESNFIVAEASNTPFNWIKLGLDLSSLLA
jgi:hypothetical protein